MPEGAPAKAPTNRSSERPRSTSSRALRELPARYFEEAQGIARAALESGSSVERHYDLGSLRCRIRFGDDRVLRALHRALLHLAVDDRGNADLSVGVWDEARAGQMLPERPGNLSVTHPYVELCSDARYAALDDPGAGFRSYLDRKAGVAWHAFDDVVKMPEHDRAAPLRLVFNPLLLERGMHLVHAAAVGTSRRGVLLTGHAGTGKSSTAFSCLGGSLSYLADSWCGISIHGPPEVFSVYSTAKLRPSGLERFAEAKAKVAGVDRGDDDKSILFIGEHWPSSLLSRCPASAILVPALTANRSTRIQPVAGAIGWRALVSSTLAHLPGLTRESVALLSRFCAGVPTFRLELGVDRFEVRAALENFVDRL